MSKSCGKDECIISCNYCERTFSQYKSMYAHVRQFHKDKPIPYKRKSNIICALCDEHQKTIKIYWNHIRLKHPEVQLSFEKKKFYSEEDFEKWRKETEARTHAHFFILRSGILLSDGKLVDHLPCDRSGFYVPQTKIRSRKCSSKKINKFCPAYIYRSKTVVDGLMEIEVDFQATHAGHKFDVHSLRIRSEKQERRVRNREKRRWPKELEKPPPVETEKNKPNVDLNGKLDSYIMEISDILQRDPNLVIQQVICNCEEYALSATCGHIKELLKNLSSIKSVQEKINVCDSNVIVDTSCVDEDMTSVVEDSSSVDMEITSVVKMDYENPVENDIMKSLEDAKASVLEEFHQLTNMCLTTEHLEILKEIVAEGKKRLFSLSEFEQRNSQLSSNIHNAHHSTSQS